MQRIFKIKILIKIRDMRVDFYTLDVRNLGQAEGAHKVGASARTSNKPIKTLAVLIESEASRCPPTCRAARQNLAARFNRQADLLTVYRTAEMTGVLS